jgi:hypothetical protein
MRLSRLLYRTARQVRTAEAIERSIETRDPAYVERRARNILLAKLLGKPGLWRIWR